MNTLAQPLEHFFDLRRLSDAGADVTIAADAAALERLAGWLDAERVTLFKAAVSLRRIAHNRFGFDVDFECDLVLRSVVSLEPVPSRVVQQFSRELHLVNRDRREIEKGEVLTLATGDDDGPEEIDSPKYDLAAPVLEELSLAIDPYPRAPGEEFGATDASGAEKESPFAVLKKLKEGG